MEALANEKDQILKEKLYLENKLAAAEKGEGEGAGAMIVYTNPILCVTPVY